MEEKRAPTRKGSSEARALGALHGALLALLVSLGAQVVEAEAESGVGESCGARSDCLEGLRCIRNVCAEPASEAEAAPEVAPALVGDPCGARSDCLAGLRCVANVCVEHEREDVQPTATTPAAAGHRCGARSDCEEGLRCIANVCVEPESVERAAPEDSGEAHASQDVDESSDDDEPAGDDSEPSEWASFELDGLHPVVGVALAPGIAGFVPFSGEMRTEPSGLFSVRGGVLLGRTELFVELAPATWIWDPDPRRFTVVLGVMAGHLFRIFRNIYWPVRGGLGVAANDLPISAYLHTRLDVIGLVYHFGHLLFEVDLPSFRFDTDMQRNAIIGVVFCVSVSYVI